MEETAPNHNIHCSNEYGTLKKVVVTPPSYMEITEPINETQKYYKESNIDKERAEQEHKQFIQLLEENGVEVLEVPAASQLPEQVFTRDIAFAIGRRLILASMGEHVRQEETDIVKEWFSSHSIPYESPPSGSIEGGDVLLDEDTIWLGQGRRTSSQAAEDLKKRFPDYSVEPIPITEDILHLDCVFSILDKETAIIYPPAFSDEGLRKIKDRFRTIISVSEEERFHMGPNVLSLGNNTVVSLTIQERLNTDLREQGFHVLEHDFSEIIKSGGSFRCCTLPLLRD
ncbi:dimethylarginine dimethylaminohydrolase family protein [Salimicrobium flavidum]|uniref:N-Dimethylarginine dimethylaminohydrolase n=1 Tax=Salimicrobium flavidum TaxID=570947 RepID=A0A1N7K9P4_9BACI|nr:arginine deiminase family protein [Salimicrobium flavidum]SIS58250.1 N-Dimethylarginine dimethylaminohydrolase [Salimicrobium flavidum]